MEQEISVSASSSLKATHSFIHNGKRYPFNMKLFKCFSQYFQINKNLFKNINEINLLDDQEEKIALTESSINDFISFCHKDKIILTNENVLSLHILSKKYIVPSLIDATANYITAHRKDLVVELLILNQDDPNSDNKEYEEMISNDLIEYIKNDRLLLLPLTSLYRIVTRYNGKSDTDELTIFLFKCLDKFGRPASVLFENHKFGASKTRFISLIHQKYSDKFDFHFLNSHELTTIYESDSELIKRTSNMANELGKMKNEQKTKEKEKDAIIQHLQEEIERMRQQIDERDRAKDAEYNQKLQEEIERIRQQIEERDRAKDVEYNQKLQDEIERMRQQIEERDRVKDAEYNQKLNEIRNEVEQMNVRSKEDEKIDHLRNEFLSQFEVLNGKIRQLEEKVTEQESSINAKMSITPSFSCSFSSDLKGILSHLGSSVTISAGGSHSPNNPVTNILTYDDTYFSNYYSQNPQSESQSYINFDFGPSKRVDLYSYLIRSNKSDQSQYSHPKTWRIEGSNDNSNWTRLDRRVNDESVNGKFKQHNFECQENLHLESSRYRFIKYVQENNWDKENRKYNIYITYFELYGNVFNI